MPEFENLVQGQMEIMDKLLYLQAEIERCQKIEKEISQKRKDLAQIQDLFQKQTEQVIQAYQRIEA